MGADGAAEAQSPLPGAADPCEAQPSRCGAHPSPARRSRPEDDADRSPTVRLTVNGRAVEREVEARRSLADFLREDLGLTGTHVGCEHGVCGACTVLVDGPERAELPAASRRSSRARAVTTIEGLTPRRAA